jgi:hypothetical protein
MNQKRKLVFSCLLLLALGTAVILLFSRIPRITASKVDRIVVWTQALKEPPQLDAGEKGTIISLFNKARYMGKGTGEGGTPEYGVVVYLKDGSRMQISAFHGLGRNFEVSLHNAKGKKTIWCYINSPELEDFLENHLLGKFGLAD